MVRALSRLGMTHVHMWLPQILPLRVQATRAWKLSRTIMSLVYMGDERDKRHTLRVHNMIPKHRSRGCCYFLFRIRVPFGVCAHTRVYFFLGIRPPESRILRWKRAGLLEPPREAIKGRPASSPRGPALSGSASRGGYDLRTQAAKVHIEEVVARFFVHC